MADTNTKKAGRFLRRIEESGRSLGLTNANGLAPQELELSPTVATSLSAIVGVLRWGAVLIGLVYAANAAVQGDTRIVGTVAVAIFLTSWRTINPMQLGDRSRSWLFQSLGDVVILAAAVGIREGLTNPLVGTLLISVAVTAFGWGIRRGVVAALLALVVSTGVLILTGDASDTDKVPGPVAVTALAGAAILPGVALDRLLEMQGRQNILIDERDKLTRTNSLLNVLNDLARTLPSSLDLPDVVSHARRELIETFDAKRLAILSYEDGKWSPLIQEGFHLPPELAEEDLPPLLQQAAQSVGPMLVYDLDAVTDRAGSGIYARLVVRNADTGLLVIEHPEPNRYAIRDTELLEGMADVLGLTLANARSFNQLRSLAAAEERSKIARDLHDRLGQYLTYIGLELERINQKSQSSELKVLHEDVQSAVAEFRDTLLELRAAVTVDRPLSVVLSEVVERFAKRSELEVELTVPNSGERLHNRIENEFLRIAQEALTNVEKHAVATKVHVRWTVSEGKGVLVVQDDGRGFDPAMGIRGNAFGLVGMRERAASVGALLTISSKPGEGTAITVQSSQPSE